MGSRAGISWLVILSLALASGAAADYQTSYGQGLEALDKGQWSEAADWFRQAIDEHPEAGGKVSAAGKRQTYVPYFQLGLTLYRAGAYREASEAWRTSAVQGALSRKMKEIVEEYRWDIEARLAEQAAKAAEAASRFPAAEAPARLSGQQLETRRQAAETQLDRGEHQIAALEAPDLGIAFDTDASLAGRRDRGIEKLRQAREIYDKAGKGGDPIALQEVHERAVDAATMLEDVRFSATILALKLEPETESASAVETDPVVAVVPPVEEPIEPGEESGDPLAGTPGDLLAEAPGDLSPPAIVEAEPVALEPTASAQDNGPPDFLRDAAIAFFSARYQDALSTLDRDDLENRRVLKHAHLFRAASLYALYLLEGRQDVSRLQSAEAAARACRAIDPGLRPTIEGFSPSFVSFFESVVD